MNCIFCKIVNKEIPSHKVYEDELVYAFLDISQGTKGHTLVVPKKHYKDIFELDATISNHIFDVVVKLSKVLKEALGCEGINLVNNNTEVAGQTVFHYHMHIIPRYSKEDKVTITHEDNTGKTSQEEFVELVNKITSKL